MALITCPDCNRQVSSLAVACPGCGYPIASAHGELGPGGQKPLSALQSPQVWGRVTGVVGAWLVAPWIARMLAVVGACVMGYFLFRGGRQ
ncbi:hypothetical protein [Acidovorax sp. Leaf78]|uniref:hypothetical protein n=1 Tax=unclassified Acidovorax TaxID=2684926 RepID=UPI0006F982FC|nr:hypothetical protein [Acidovorax sp. Leaf78]KQO27651.1 hypothetical protein ASF16_02125 [Acidovorax sp. Leaf78]